MLDPLALTAATLLTTRALEGLGGEAGKSAWLGVQRLARAVREKLANDPDGESVLEHARTIPQDQALILRLAQVLDRHLSEDTAFHATLTGFVADMRRNPVAGQFVTQISDSAQVGKVVQIGNVEGDVTF
jgi:hypothetical protein